MLVVIVVLRRAHYMTVLSIYVHLNQSLVHKALPCLPHLYVVNHLQTTLLIKVYSLDSVTERLQVARLDRVEYIPHLHPPCRHYVLHQRHHVLVHFVLNLSTARDYCVRGRFHMDGQQVRGVLGQPGEQVREEGAIELLC